MSDMSDVRRRDSGLSIRPIRFTVPRQDERRIFIAPGIWIQVNIQLKAGERVPKILKKTTGHLLLMDGSGARRRL